MCVLKCRLVEKQAGEQKEVPYVSDGTVSSLLGAGASSLPRSPSASGPSSEGLVHPGQGHPWPLRPCRVPQRGASKSDGRMIHPSLPRSPSRRCQLPAFKNRFIVFLL